MPALCVLDQRSCWTPSDGAAAIPRFAHSPRADTEILRSLVIVGLVSVRCPLARCAPLAVPLRAIAALRLRSEHGSSHAHWARWGTIMRTSLASRASSDGAHPDRADSRIGPRAFLYPLSHTNTPLQPLPKMLAAYPRPIGSRVYGLAHSALYPIQPDARYTLAATSRGRLCCGT